MDKTSKIAERLKDKKIMERFKDKKAAKEVLLNNGCSEFTATKFSVGF